MSHDTGRSQSRLEAAASAVTIPAELRHAWDRAAPRLGAGQIWRARWDDDVQFVVTLRTHHETLALPLSFDPDFADTGTVRIAAEANPFGVVMTAWPGLAQPMPGVVFDRFAGHLTDQVLHVLISAPPAVGQDPLLPHPVRVYRAQVEDTMATLSAARWYSSGSGQLNAILQRAGLDVRGISEVLRLKPQRALAIWRGQAAVTRGDAEALAPLLGESAETILAHNPTPPTELIASLDQPGRHRQVLAFATQLRVDLPTAYSDLAYQTWALAARQTGAKVTNWDLRLDALFAAVLDEQ